MTSAAELPPPPTLTRIKVLHVITRLQAGAGGNTLLSALGMDPARYEVWIAGVPGGGLWDRARAAGVHTVEIPGFRTVELAERPAGGSVRDRQVAVLGAAFKPGSDDVRDPPALAVAEARGAQVCVHDPEAADNARVAHPALQFAPDVTKTCDHADVVLHLTEWPQYRELDRAALASVVRTPVIVDARHTLDVKAWRAAGWTLCAPGRPGQADSGRVGEP
ncbi:UDP binding domain-containing protein [Streptomyces sp. NPDC005483]|uniref:UDP binding domain-containing protein n=1 Tax=Streptomyces sp. NPDC005483 TaxID=3154882 RepID=UPI0033B146D5